MSLLAIGIVSGLGLGAVYALISLGYSLVLAASGVFNFAQGSVVMGATLLSFLFGQSLHLPFVVSLVLVLAVGAVTGGLMYALAVGPVARRQGGGGLTEGTMVTTLGLGLALNTAMAILFGSEVKPVGSYVSDNPIVVNSVPIKPIYVVMVAVTLTLAVLLEVILRRTRVGLMLRATVEDSEGAALEGIFVRRVVIRSFIVAGALAALAGLLIAPVTSASPFIADQITLYGFAGMAIGGFGSFAGALIGGLVVGLIGTITPLYLAPHYTNVLLYGVVVLVLVLRPRGLFGSAGAFGAAQLRRI